jgi:cephalosporin-C deacetylase
MFVDLPLDQLRTYRPYVAEPDDFDAFWADQLAQARSVVTAPVFAPVDTPLRSVQVFDLTFPGYAGDPVRGWLLLPEHEIADAPLVVEYIGYNGGRGDPLDWLPWSASGFPHLVMDSRGQGGGWRGAATADPHDGEPSTNGLMTRGIADPQRYYYTRLFVDAVRAVDAALTRPELAGRPVLTTGASQGGALSIVAAAHHDAVTACAPDVPFLAHPRRAAMITESRPFGELAEYCAVYPDRVAQVFATLSYIDVVNHAKRAEVPALFSVALLDDITPASTVFAAYNHYRGAARDIAVYEFNDHAGGGTLHLRRKLAFAASAG